MVDRFCHSARYTGTLDPSVRTGKVLYLLQEYDR